MSFSSYKNRKKGRKNMLAWKEKETPSPHFFSYDLRFREKKELKLHERMEKNRRYGGMHMPVKRKNRFF